MFIAKPLGEKASGAAFDPLLQSAGHASTSTESQKRNYVLYSGSDGSTFKMIIKTEPDQKVRSANDT